MAATKKKEFLAFGPAERLAVAREALRGAEEGYYRASLGVNLPGTGPDQAISLDAQWTRVEELQAEFKAVEAEASE